MSYRLVIIEENDKYRIAWFIEDCNEIGLILGDGFNVHGQELHDVEEWKTWIAERIANMSLNVHHDSLGFYWDSNKEAKAVLSIIKVQWKAKQPLKEWEKQAISAGWKPPKGWNGS